MNAYELLKDRLTKNMYRRGQYKGDAPLEKRTKNHIRIVQRTDCMCVQMYGTKILTAYMDGSIAIALDGWHNSSTTKQWINYALGITGFYGFYIGNKSVMSLSQLAVSTPKGAYLYYDGIRFNGDGTLASEPKPFGARRIDKSESKAFTEDIKASGFKDVYSLLYATCTPPDDGRTMYRDWKDYLQDPDHADKWPSIVEYHKYELRWDHTTGQRKWRETYDDAKACWAAMMKLAKQGMYNNVTTEVTHIDK
jgi:hypothetical protein